MSRRKALVLFTILVGLQLLITFPAMADQEQNLLAKTPPISSLAGLESQTSTVKSAPQLQDKLPSDVTLKPDQIVLNDLIQKGYFNAFADNLFHPNAPITRAEFATLLYRATGITAPFVREFAYYQDVPTDYWAYTPIEGLRVRDMITGFAGGFFKPDQPISRLSAGVMLSKTLDQSWQKLSQKEIESTFKVYNQSTQNIPEGELGDLAESIYAGFLLPIHMPNAKANEPDFQLGLDQPLSRMDAARVVYRRALMAESETGGKKEEVISIPPGIEMLITPTTALAPERLFDGEAVFFALTRWVKNIPGLNTTLPRGTRIHGKVMEISADKMQANIYLDRANLPSGEFYDMSASVSIEFKPNPNGQIFIVPGEVFHIITRGRQH